MKILFIGDVVASLGRKTLSEFLPKLVKDKKIDLVIANIENLAHGKGATRETIDELRAYGVNVMTSGNHIWFREEIEEILETDSTIIRPANYPTDLPGKGYVVVDVQGPKNQKEKVLIINLLGRQWIDQPVQDPFRTVDAILKEQGKKFGAIIVDFHAEATSEKMAMGWYLDGRVTATLGTHTHVPSADQFVMSKGSAYVTDVGMTGAVHSVLGVDPDIIIKAHKYPYPTRFEWVEEGPSMFRSVLVETDKSGLAKSITRIDKLFD